MSKPLRTFRQAFPILKYLAIHPNMTPYAVQEELKIERHTVLDSLRLLEKANLVIVTSRKKLPTGLERKEYKTTAQGVVALLQAHPEYINVSKSDVEAIASKSAQFLPLIFGKWDAFQKMNVEDTAYQYLILAVKHTEDEVERLDEVATGQGANWSFDTQESVHRHDIYETMLVRAPMLGNSEADHWAQIVRSDSGLRKMAEKEISKLLLEAKDQLRTWESALDALRGEKSRYGVIMFETPDQNRVIEHFDGLVKYERAIALDEGKPLKSDAEYTGQAVKELLDKVEQEERRNLKSGRRGSLKANPRRRKTV